MKGKKKEIGKVMQLVTLETSRNGDTDAPKKRQGHQTIRLFPLWIASHCHAPWLLAVLFDSPLM
jgi:hypothetical protein